MLHRALIGALGLSAFLSIPLVAAGAQTPADSIALERRVREIAGQIRCPVCLNLSIGDTPSELGRDMRALIRDRLQRGETDEQVIQYFVDRYGEWILMQPTARGVNLLVWLLPAAAVLGGGVVVILAVRRWTRNAAAQAAAAEPVSDEYLRKVQEELARGDHD